MVTGDGQGPGRPRPDRGDDHEGGRSLRYLGDRWLARADEALSGLTPVPADVAVGVTVTGGPEGERRYRLILGPDRVGIDDRVESVGVRMTLDWEEAVAIAQGRTSAQRAFLDGRLRLGGDAGLLLGHQDALAGIDDRLADLRAVTRYA
jgi:hypothetical protein